MGRLILKGTCIEGWAGAAVRDWQVWAVAKEARRCNEERRKREKRGCRDWEGGALQNQRGQRGGGRCEKKQPQAGQVGLLYFAGGRQVRNRREGWIRWRAGGGSGRRPGIGGATPLRRPGEGLAGGGGYIHIEPIDR